MRKVAKIVLSKSPFSKTEPQTLIEKYGKYIKFDPDINQIRMYTDIPEYHEFLLEVRANLLRISQGFELEYSKEDYDRASYFILGSLRLVDSVYEDEPEALYVRRCTRCNVYIDQKQDLIIKKKNVSS